MNIGRHEITAMRTKLVELQKKIDETVDLQKELDKMRKERDFLLSILNELKELVKNWS